MLASYSLSSRYAISDGLMNAADTAQVTQVHPHEECFSNNILVRHKAPVAAVRAVVAVVAHHEIVARRNHAGKAFITVGARFAVRELLHVRQVDWRGLLIVENAVADAGQVFLELL